MSKNSIKLHLMSLFSAQLLLLSTASSLDFSDISSNDNKPTFSGERRIPDYLALSKAAKNPEEDLSLRVVAASILISDNAEDALECALSILHDKKTLFEERYHLLSCMLMNFKTKQTALTHGHQVLTAFLKSQNPFSQHTIDACLNIADLLYKYSPQTKETQEKYLACKRTLSAKKPPLRERLCPAASHPVSQTPLPSTVNPSWDEYYWGLTPQFNGH